MLETGLLVLACSSLSATAVVAFTGRPVHSSQFQVPREVNLVGRVANL